MWQQQQSSSRKASSYGRQSGGGKMPTAVNDDSMDAFDKLVKEVYLEKRIENMRNFIAFEVSSCTRRSEGNDSRKRFYQFFPKLLDYIFGEDSEKRDGGWLTRSSGTVSPPHSSAANVFRASMDSSNSRSMPSEVDLLKLSREGKAMLRLLSGSVDEDGSIFNVLFASVHHPVEYKFELSLLPSPTQLSICSRSAANISVLYTHVLTKPLSKQMLDPRNPALMLSITEYFLFYFLRYPISRSRSGNGNGNNGNGGGTSQSSNVRKTYMSSLSTRSDFYTQGMTSILTGNPYVTVLLQYLQVFFPSSSRRHRDHPGRNHAFLFMHALIEMWLLQNATSYKKPSLHLRDVEEERSTFRPFSASVATARFDASHLVTPWSQAHIMGEYIAPTDDVFPALLLTLIYLLGDPIYPLQVVPTVDGNVAMHHRSSSTPSTCLSNPIQLMQKPLFDFLSVGFARCQIGISRDSFHALATIWLVYLQPWKCQTWLDPHVWGSTNQVGYEGEGTSNQERGAMSMEYSLAWEGYVLSNYHFYTTLLGSFLVQVRSLDFSLALASLDNHRNLRLLRRVLDVFNDDLLDVLDRADRFLQDHSHQQHQHYQHQTHQQQQQQQQQLHYQQQQPLQSLYADEHDPSFLHPLSAKFESQSCHRVEATSTTSQASSFLSMHQGLLLLNHCNALGFVPLPVALESNFRRDAERLFDKVSEFFLKGEEQAPVDPRSLNPKDSYDNSLGTAANTGSTAGNAGNAALRAKKASSNPMNAWIAASVSHVAAAFSSSSSSTSSSSTSKLSSSSLTHASYDLEARIVSEKLRRIFRIPDSYVHSASAHAWASSQVGRQEGMQSVEPSYYDLSLRRCGATDLTNPTNSARGLKLLTKEGVRQIQEGWRMSCNDSVPYIGDAMLKPMTSMEIACLVRLLYRVSRFLNRLFKLDTFDVPRNYHQLRFEEKLQVYEEYQHVLAANGWHGFRINLRFLAHQGVCVCMAALVLMLYWQTFSAFPSLQR